MANCWHSVDADLNDILIVIGCSTIVYSNAYCHIWQPINRFDVQMFAYKSFDVTQSLIQHWQITWVIHDIGLSRCSAVSLQLISCISVLYIMIYIAPLYCFSSSSLFYAICMTYQKQFSIYLPLAPGLCRELCSLINDAMKYDFRHASWFVFCFGHSIYDSYDIKDLIVVSEFRVQFSFNFLT
jgi:hypothetical protein